MKVDPKYSAGARYERKAFREYLKRKMKRWQKPNTSMGAELRTLKLVLNYVRTRQARYDKKPGGL